MAQVQCRCHLLLPMVLLLLLVAPTCTAAEVPPHQAQVLPLLLLPWA
jgi:hypothetical protein